MKEMIDTALLIHVITQLRKILASLEEVETGVATNQEKLNQISSDLNEATANVQSEFQSLKEQVAAGSTPEDLDFSGLESAVNSLQQATSAVESGEPRPDQSLPGQQSQRR